MIAAVAMRVAAVCWLGIANAGSVTDVDSFGIAYAAHKWAAVATVVLLER